MTIEELTEKAKSLGLEVKEEATEDEINKLITDKEEEDKKKLEDDNKKADPDYLKSELKKVIDQRDTAKKDKRALQNKVDELSEAIKNAPKTDEFKELKDSLKELKDYKEAIEKEREEEELKQKTELERTQITFEKEMKKLREEIENEKGTYLKQIEDEKAAATAKDKEIETLRKVSLEGEILAHASENGAIKPRQIVGLLKDSFEYVPSLGKFVHSIYDAKGKLIDTMEVAEKVADFLKDSENDNLVKSNANTKGMDTKPTDKTKNVDVKDLGKYNPKDPDLVREAGEKGLTVEELINTKIMRDKKFAKMRGEGKE